MGYLISSMGLRARRGFAIGLGVSCFALLPACGGQDDVTSGSGESEPTVADDSQVYSLTVVTRGPDGEPSVFETTITAREQERMKAERTAWEAKQPRATERLTAAAQAIDSESVARGAARLPRPSAELDAPSEAEESGESVGEISSAIRVDKTCSWDSLWLFDGTNLTGSQLCVADTGILNLATQGWAGRVRSLWGSSGYGGSMMNTAIPRGSCSNTCLNWGIGQQINSLSCSSTFSLLDQGLYEQACWLTSSAYTNVSDYPSNTGRDWTENAQGVTTDKANYWYITQRDVIRRVPLTRDLNSDLNGYPNFTFSATESARGYNHMGDLDHFEGRLYVPLEGGDLGPVVSFSRANSTMSFINLTPLTAQDGGSWLAVNPKDGYLYSSDYNDGYVRKYRRDIVDGKLDLVYLHSIQLRTSAGNQINLKRIQGGAFSPSGKLYLVSWDEDPNKAGIYGFGLEGLQRVFRKVNYEPRWTLGWYTGDELEGLEIFDLDSGIAPGIRGQLHTLMIDVDSATDDMYFKHSRISNPLNL